MPNSVTGKTIANTGAANAIVLQLGSPQSGPKPDTTGTITLYGPFSAATVLLEGQTPEGQWAPLGCMDVGLGTWNPGGTAITLTSGAVKVLRCDVTGFVQIRVRTNSQTGNVTVSLYSDYYYNQPVMQVTSNTTSVSGPTTITSTSANALAVGPAGTTNPAFNVDASTASAATGINVKAAAAGAGVAESVLSSGTNESLTIDAKGTDSITLNGVGGTGAIQFGGAGSGNNATGFKVTPNAAASGVTLAVVSTGSNENCKIDAKGGGEIAIGSVSTGFVSIGRGAVAPPILANTISSLGTAQSSTPTSAQICGGVVTQTSSTGAGTVTLPTGTQIETTLTANSQYALANGDSFTTTFANLGGGQTLTITTSTGLTLVGTAAVSSGKICTMEFVRTGANTWTVYLGASA